MLIWLIRCVSPSNSFLVSTAWKVWKFRVCKIRLLSCAVTLWPSWCCFAKINLFYLSKRWPVESGQSSASLCFQFEEFNLTKTFLPGLFLFLTWRKGGHRSGRLRNIFQLQLLNNVHSFSCKEAHTAVNICYLQSGCIAEPSRHKLITEQFHHKYLNVKIQIRAISRVWSHLMMVFCGWVVKVEKFTVFHFCIWFILVHIDQPEGSQSLEMSHMTPKELILLLNRAATNHY